MPKMSLKYWRILGKKAELGTPQFCRDNVTMLSSHKVVCNCNFTIFIVATPSRHWGLTIYRFFSVPWLVPEAILRCREAKKVSRAQLCCTLTLQYVREVLADMIMTNAKEDSPCWRPLCHRANSEQMRLANKKSAPQNISELVLFAS